MARLSALFLAFLLGATSAVALASCGGNGEADLLPGTTADQIEANLEEVEQLADAGDCFGAEGTVAEVAAQVEELEGVDLKLKTALEEGTARLSEVVGRCEEETSEETEPTPESDVEAEDVEEDEKPKKEKPDKEDKPSKPQEEPAEDEGPELPSQANGKGEEKGGGEGAPPSETPAEETPPSGGVGPSVGVE